MSNFISNQYYRTKAAFGLTNTLLNGFQMLYESKAYRSDVPRNRLMPYVQKFCQKMANSFGVTVIQIEPVPQRHGLWVSNHVSWLDIPVVGSVAPVFFLSKAEIGKWPIFGRLAKAGGTLFIQRGSGDVGSVSDQIAEFLSEGSSVIFFPEATTTDGKQIKKIYGKLLKAAIDTNLPICPMVIAYVDKEGGLSDKAAYYGKRTMVQSLKSVADARGITAYVLPLEPIYPEGRDHRELTEVLQAVMQKGLTELHGRVLAA